MDTDSADLNLVLETSTDDIQNGSSPAVKEIKTDKSETLDDKTSPNTQSTPAPIPSSGLTIRSASGNNQPRRIQFVTLSSTKP